MKTTQLTTTPNRAVALMAWANIAVQALLPISLSLSPVVYASVAESKLRTDSLVVYQVQLGDTAISIAKQFGLTLEELKKLNSEAYKDKSLNALQIGDTLLVPDLRLGERKPAHRIAVKMERDTETLIAEAASSLAAGSAGNSLRSAAVSQANQSVEEWLKQYGTARVSLNVDDNFNLTDSEADLLVSLDDTPELLSFTQLGLRHRDDRTTVNAGVGQRHFDTKDVEMLGYNLFFDHEIEAGHTRVGVGLEYWRDYLKLSANGYIGLSGWKASEELVDYDERAADGLDLRAEAYLPSHPQLGGKLKYEQYFGNEVALSNTENRQKDPYSTTIGVNYTPIPLITAGVDYIKEKGQSGDTQFNLEFNYRLGESLDKQLDGAAMAEYRSLAGSRYDLVERNNNIVLEYRKQELLKLNVVDEFNSWPEISEQQLVVNVASKYPLDRIEWEGHEFFAAGGKIAPLSSRTTQGDSQFKVTLPAYQSEGVNLYTLVAKAIDNKGNESNTDSTNVEVTINNTAAPMVTDLKMRGKLEIGQKLEATYVWDANGGERTDKSNYQWGNKGETATLKQSADIDTSGVIPAIDLIAADAGKVKEVSIQAENGLSIMGNTLTVDSSMESGGGNETEGGNQPEGEVIDPNAGPQVADLKMSGTLEVGQTLNATYTFNPNGGETTDKSNFMWGNKGDTAGMSAGADISTTGIIPGVELVAADAGKVKEISIQAENGLNIAGNTLTVDSSMESGGGNETEGGNQPEGEVIDPNAGPQVADLKMSGKLEVGETLNATYTFNPNGGETTDKSNFMWGNKGETASMSSGADISTTGVIPGIQLISADVGQVKEVSIQAENGLNKTGNTLTLDTSIPDNGTEGGNQPEGEVIDPNAGPLVANLKMSGKLEVGETLNATYTFNPNNGESTDKSNFMWGNKGETAGMSSGADISTSGIIPGVQLVMADVGQVKEVSIQAENGLNKTGNTLTLDTSIPDNGTEGGNQPEGEVIDPNAGPLVADLKMSGKLEVGENLNATYTFNPNNGESTDKSNFMWGNKGETAGMSSGADISTSGTIPGVQLVMADVGQVKEVSIQAENGLNKTGNTLTLDTSIPDNGTEGGNQPEGEVINPTGKPLVADLKMSGKLEVGETLNATYTFNPNGGESTDKSNFMWGNKGETAGMSSGADISTSGTIPGVQLVAADVGQVKEVSIQAENGSNITGNTLTLDTSIPDNGTEGGNQPEGEVIDPNAGPLVADLKMSGKLEVGETLNATYTFNPNGGESTDKSNFQWGNKGETAGMSSGTDISTSGTIPGVQLVAADVGQVKEVSIQAENGLNKTGNTLTLDTSIPDNGTEGGNQPEGEVIDPNAGPLVADLKMSGKLEVGETLNATYTFNSNGGESTDKSNFMWGNKGETAGMSSGADISTSGTIPGVQLVAADVGQVKEVSIQAENGLNKTGNTLTLDTSIPDNGTEGGNQPEGEVIDPNAGPLVADLKMSGKLEVGETLNATYTFNPNGGESTDKSNFMWGNKGQTAGMSSGADISTSGTIPSVQLVAADAGKVKEVSIQAENGLNKTGNTLTLDTSVPGNGTEGGNQPEGEVIDPNGKPAISNLVMNGVFEVDEILSATYEWDPRTGDRTDKSLYQWGYDTDDTESLGTPSTITTSGQIAASRPLDVTDMGKIIELSAKAQNARNVQGNTLTVQSSGVITDPSIIPVINNLRISGMLDMGNTLKGTYEFDAQGGDDNDKSHFEWGYKGSSASFSAQNEVPARNTVGD
ncbi:inverse autotransporter beta domain-containing protein, partial [Plesiomonas sp.]|uniref:inverse autotransporter beta domain-containing protein n=1 Tax=Plesiomonas sp. TaxID=2486279 RepID=UPI003F2EECE4